MIFSKELVTKSRATIYVAFFLAFRDIRRSNIWTTLLIVFVMGLTFLNMLLIGGILLGISDGIISSFKQNYTSDVFITPSRDKNSIEHTDSLMQVVENLPSIEASTIRYTAAAVVEHGYKNKLRQTDLTDSVAGLLSGINPRDEQLVTNIKSQLIEGEFITENDADSVVLGANFFTRHSSVRPTSDERKLIDVYPGDKVRITVNGIQKEVTIKGIIKTNNDNIDSRIIMSDSQVRSLTNNQNLDASEIAIKLIDGANAKEAEQFIVNSISNKNDVLVRVAADALPSGIEDIRETFRFLGNIVGVISLIVGAVTIFIVIFVNAITRRKFIGILQGIGISSQSIELSYVFQAIFYATSGILLGAFLIIYLLRPYFLIHPIQTPIADGILSISNGNIISKSFILLITGIISGYIPARIVTKQNTLDAILGR
jgi:putative ABC transport system permease protein